MPVKIQNKITDEIRLVSLKESKNLIKDEPTNWQIVARKDIVQVTQPNILQRNGLIDLGEFEKKDAEQLLIGNPSYRIIKVPDWGDWNKLKISKIKKDNQTLAFLFEAENLLPINKPKIYTERIISAIVKPAKSIFDNFYIKSVMIGLLILIIWFFIYPYLKSYFKHS